MPETIKSAVIDSIHDKIKYFIQIAPVGLIIPIGAIVCIYLPVTGDGRATDG